MRQLMLAMPWMLLSLGLSSCNTVQLTCLPMKEYPVQQQTDLAAKVAAADPAIRGLVQDYFQMRQANRACKGIK